MFEPLPAVLVSSALARADEDVVWWGRLLTGEELALLVAHQSTADDLIAYRAARGVSFLHEQTQREQQARRVPRATQRLPAVVPLLVHTGRRPWTPPRLAALQPDAPVLRAFRLDLELLVLDLPSEAEADLSGRGGVLGALLVLFKLQYAPRATFARALDRTLRRLRSLVPDREAYLMLAFFCFQLVRNRRSPEELAMLKPVFDRHATRKEADAMVRTAAEVDRAEGRAEGRAEARREDVLAVLEARFGSPSAALVEALGAVDDAAALGRLVPRAAVVPTVEAFERELRGTG